MGKQQSGGDDGQPQGVQPVGTSNSGAFPQAPSVPDLSASMKDVANRSASDARPPEPPPPTRKALRLSDNEILSLFRGAQKEASLEADWRGIGDAPSRKLPSTESRFGKLDGSPNAGLDLQKHSQADRSSDRTVDKKQDQETLRM